MKLKAGGRSLNIMLVDGSYLTRAEICSLLEKNGHQISHYAHTFKEGLNVFAQSSQTINLMLVDILLSERSGLDFLKEVTKQNFKGKLIAMSSLSSERIILDCLTNGAIDFIRKPLRPKDLIKAVKKVEIELEKSI